MKFSSSIIGAVLLSCRASADLVSNNKNAITEGNLETLRDLKYVDKEVRQKNGAAEVGYGMASVLWDRDHKNFCFGGVNRM